MLLHFTGQLRSHPAAFFYLIDKCAINLPFNRKPQSLSKKLPERDHNPHGVSYMDSVLLFFFFFLLLCGGLSFFLALSGSHIPGVLADSRSPVLVLTVQKQIPCSSANDKTVTGPQQRLNTYLRSGISCLQNQHPCSVTEGGIRGLFFYSRCSLIFV